MVKFSQLHKTKKTCCNSTLILPTDRAVGCVINDLVTTIWQLQQQQQQLHQATRGGEPVLNQFRIGRSEIITSETSELIPKQGNTASKGNKCAVGHAKQFRNRKHARITIGYYVLFRAAGYVINHTQRVQILTPGSISRCRCCPGSTRQVALIYACVAVAYNNLTCANKPGEMLH